MSDENGGNNGRVNPLDVIFIQEPVRVEVLDPRGEPTGVVGVFNPIEPRVKARYDQIIQKGFGGRKPRYDEGDLYVFPKIISEIEGLTAEDCGGVDPIRFCISTPKGRMLLKILMNGYWAETIPTTEEGFDAQKK